MAHLNKVYLIGNVGKEPLLRYWEGTTPMVKFSLANKGRLADQPTQWHQIVAWNALADYIAASIHKGDLIFLEGEITYRTWEDKQSGNLQRDVIILAKEITKL